MICFPSVALRESISRQIDEVQGPQGGERGLEFSRRKKGHFSPFTFLQSTTSEVAQSCPTLCNPMECSLPGSSIHGIFQARVLE